MAQKLISRINQRAHYSKNEDRPEVAELIKLIIKCMLSLIHISEPTRH